ncbi:MAG: hypothetical protein R2912_07760 [Eubacteriales bacterium]
MTEFLLNHTGVKAIGLCNLPISAQERIAKLLAPDGSGSAETASLNHCGAINGGTRQRRERSAASTV